MVLVTYEEQVVEDDAVLEYGWLVPEVTKIYQKMSKMAPSLCVRRYHGRNFALEL